MGAGGIATCDSCGLQYNQEWIKEKVQEIKGVVSIDNTHMIDSWMKMAKSASEAGNQKEAYEYYTRVVEIDPQNWRAIYEKGKAGAWQSTLANIRISELYQGIATALKILNKRKISNEEIAGIRNEFAVELAKVNCAIVDKKNQLFEDIKDIYFDSHLDRMIENRNMFATNVEKMEDAMSLIADLDDSLSKANVIAFKKRICDDICWACRKIAYWIDYSQSKLGYFGYKEKEKKQLIDKFWSYVLDIRMVDADYKRRYNMYEVGLPNPGDPDSKWVNDFEYWEWKQKEIDREVQRRKRNDEYWIHHKEERKELEKREKEIKEKIAEKKSTILPYKKR